MVETNLNQNMARFYKFDVEKLIFQDTILRNSGTNKIIPGRLKCIPSGMRSLEGEIMACLSQNSHPLACLVLVLGCCWGFQSPQHKR